MSNVLDARLDSGETFRAVDPAVLAKFDGESFGGFRDALANATQLLSHD